MTYLKLYYIHTNNKIYKCHQSLFTKNDSIEDWIFLESSLLMIS